MIENLIIAITLIYVLLPTRAEYTVVIDVFYSEIICFIKKRFFLLYVYLLVKHNFAPIFVFHELPSTQ